MAGNRSQILTTKEIKSIFGEIDQLKGVSKLLLEVIQGANSAQAVGQAFIDLVTLFSNILLTNERPHL